MTTLSKRLKEAREAAGLSIQELSDLVGIDQSVQRKVEKGQCGVNSDRLTLYARLLRVRSSWLLGEDQRREFEARE